MPATYVFFQLELILYIAKRLAHWNRYHMHSISILLCQGNYEFTLKTPIQTHAPTTCRSQCVLNNTEGNSERSCTR